MRAGALPAAVVAAAVIAFVAYISFRGASVEAEQRGSVRVAFRSPPDASAVPTGYAPVGWLVQTNGDDVLGVAQIPLDLKGAT